MKTLIVLVALAYIFYSIKPDKFPGPYYKSKKNRKKNEEIDEGLFLYLMDEFDD